MVFVRCLLSFLSQNNIKEVLLFPAMKPEDIQGQSQPQRVARALPAAQGATAAGQGCTAHPPVFAVGSTLLDGVDLASPAGIKKLEVIDVIVSDSVSCCLNVHVYMCVHLSLK